VPGFQLLMLKKLAFWAHSRAKKLLLYFPTPLLPYSLKKTFSANPNYSCLGVCCMKLAIEYLFRFPFSAAVRGHETYNERDMKGGA